MQRPIIHLIDNQVIVGMGMKVKGSGIPILTILTTSLSVVLTYYKLEKLLKASGRRQVPYPDKIDMTHTFTDGWCNHILIKRRLQ